MEKTLNKKGFIEGEITSYIHRQDNTLCQLWNFGLRFLNDLGFISRKTLEKNYLKGKFIRADRQKNIIADVGFAVLTAVLAEEYGSIGAIDEMALGDGVGSPAVGDTALFNEVYRNGKASSVHSSNIAIVTAFYTEVEVSGTFTEFGNFIDTTEMWSHVNVAWTKTAAETLTVQCKYTLTNKP